jgi:hypothetical protein
MNPIRFRPLAVALFVASFSCHACTSNTLDPEDKKDLATLWQVHDAIKVGMSVHVFEIALATVPAAPRLKCDVTIEAPPEKARIWGLTRERGTLTFEQWAPDREHQQEVLPIGDVMSRLRKRDGETEWRGTSALLMVVLGRWAVSAFLDDVGKVELVGRVDAIR